MQLWLTSIDGSLRLPAYQIGPHGSWGDLTWTSRWGDGACGMFEASWTMPLPPGFEHPLLRRGTLVEIKDGAWRGGSPLILASPQRGTGIEQPWQFTATGIGREVEGDHSFTAQRFPDDAATAVPSEAVDYAIAGGWRIAGRASSVPTSAIGSSSTTQELNTVGVLLTAAAQQLGQRWGVGRDNILAFRADPTTPTYQVVPGAASLGNADDDYASVVRINYLDSTTLTYKRVFALNSATDNMFGRKEYAWDLSSLGAISSTTAQSFANGILARSKGRLAWTNGLTVTSNEILTMGGVPANLSKVAEDVGNGCMVRLHGIWSQLLAVNGQTWLDIIIGEAPYVEGAISLDLKPLGLAPRDLQAVMESVTGMAA